MNIEITQTFFLKNHNKTFHPQKERGFGLVSLIITLAIIALASGAIYSSFFRKNSQGEIPATEGISAINEAKKAKQLLEQGNTVTTEKFIK